MDVLKLRQQLGLTQTELGDRLGISHSTVQRMETGSPISGPVRKLLEQLERKANGKQVERQRGASEAGKKRRG